MSTSTRNPQAFFASALLHGAMVGVILWFAWATHKEIKEAPKIFELVDGAGDNFAATEAPALGVPGGIKLEIPQPPAPSPSPVQAADPEPAPAEASPVQPAPPEPVAPAPVTPPKPAPKATAKADPKEYKSVNMAKMVDRIADKRAANIEKKIKADQAAAEARAAKEAAINARRMTKEEFDRLNKGKGGSGTAKPGTAGAGSSAKRIDSEGIAGGVVGGSTANKTGGAGGKALTRQEMELSEAYISMLIQRLRQAHQKPDGLSDLLEATVKFSLTPGGALVNVTIISSSRNAEFDQSVLAAFRRVKMPAPPANLKNTDYTLTFKMREDT